MLRFEEDEPIAEGSKPHSAHGAAEAVSRDATRAGGHVRDADDDHAIGHRTSSTTANATRSSPTT
jgi:hypothetical protein